MDEERINLKNEILFAIKIVVVSIAITIFIEILKYYLLGL